MDLQHFGDSYDIIKQRLLSCLLPCGDWAAHPMFTGPVDRQKTEAFEKFLGVKLLDWTPVGSRTQRKVVQQAKSWTEHLFLDPTTGVFIPCRRQNPSRNQSAYLKGDELAKIVKERPCKLTLVFDQSIPRGKPESRLQHARKKLEWLQQCPREIFGLTYLSHVSFILLSTDCTVLKEAREQLLENSCIPERRLVELEQEATQ